MKRQDFNFELPTELVAQYPLPERSDSRLLVYHRETEQYEHRQFKDVVDFLKPGDLLVMNDSKVIPARLYGRKASGGKVELLIERILEESCFLSHIKASKTLQTGHFIYLDEGWSVEILGRKNDLFLCRCKGELDVMLRQIGHIPLPPYITRTDEHIDSDRYQTVYARYDGSVAAPTAGLHFDEALLRRLAGKGVEMAYSTLHVGAGTFRPVRCEQITEHQMHREYFTVSEELSLAVNRAREERRRVIAVGTTALRSLESAATTEGVLPCSRDTDIFIFPGYSFKVCDGLITNFHLPESTLLMLVSAFIGHERAMQLYQKAVEERYRFFSYGDACFFV